MVGDVRPRQPNVGLGAGSLSDGFRGRMDFRANRTTNRIAFRGNEYILQADALCSKIGLMLVEPKFLMYIRADSSRTEEVCPYLDVAMSAVQQHAAGMQTLGPPFFPER